MYQSKAIWLKSRSSEGATRSYWVVTCESKVEIYATRTVYYGTLREVLKATRRTMRAHVFELASFLTQICLAQHRECRINAVRSSWRKLGKGYTRILCVQGITDSAIVNSEVRYIVSPL